MKLPLALPVAAACVALVLAAPAAVAGAPSSATATAVAGAPSPTAPPPLARSAAPQVDDFSDPDVTSLGFPRIYITDASAGGQTSLQHRIADGVFAASGDIAPPRGQPGWASTALLLHPEGQAMDASAFEGIRLRVRINAGNLSVSANSTEVTNFDFHAAAVRRQTGDDFHEVKIPFSSMKRAWSEQTKLDPATLASISLVAFDVQQGAFDYEIDEVGFY